MMDSVQDFMTETRTERRIEAKRHAENKTRLNILIALALLIVTFIGVLIAWKGLSKVSEFITTNPNVTEAIYQSRY